MEIWTDRLVLLGNIAIMPGMIRRIDLEHQEILLDCKWYDASGARRDRATGLTDKNGKEIFERDRVREGIWEGTVVFRNGAFMVEWDSGVTSPVRGTAGCGEVIGMEPYKEADDE
jgi:hypothetical protein